LGEQMEPSSRFDDAHHLRERLASVRQRLKDVAADGQVELRVGKREAHRIVSLESRPLTEIAAPEPRALEVRLLQIDAQVGDVREEAQERRGQLPCSASHVEDARSPRWTIPAEDGL